MPDGHDTTVERLSARGPLLLGGTTAMALVLGFGIWAATVPIDGAVMAMGQVDIVAQSYLVQHTEGGVVDELAVREGQSVEAGDLLLRLNGGALDQELALVTAQLIEAQARSMRLSAERNGDPFVRSEIEGPMQLAIAEQWHLYSLLQNRLQRQTEQLDQRAVQTEAQLSGILAQDRALETEAVLLNEHLSRQQQLHELGLTQTQHLAAAVRDVARINGARAGIVARRAELHGQLAEIRLQAETLQAAHREEAEAQLVQTSAQILELTTRQGLLAERQAGLTLRAPVAGVVHGLAALAPGAVLRPADIALQIVTRPDRPVLAVHVRPEDIDHIHLGQFATIRFPALERDLPDLLASVAAISAAPFTDEHSGSQYYRVEVALTDDAIAQVNDRTLLAGLTVSAFLTTGARTPLAYLVAPITRQLRRALREP